MSSAAVDAALEEFERTALLAEVRVQLPLWLQRAAQPAPSPTGQIVDLLGFSRSDIDRARAAHLVLSREVARFADCLLAGVRFPAPTSDRPREMSQVVRGPVDWSATARLQASGQPATFSVRPRQRIFDSPEHRALRWLMRVVHRSCDQALGRGAGPASSEGSWTGEVQSTLTTLRAAARAEWLSDVRVERPSGRTRRALQHSRSPFIRHAVAPAIEKALSISAASDEGLADMLSQRYFVPERDWRLFEVVVLMRLDKALASASDGLRRRLFSDGGEVASYKLPGGDRVLLRYQGWPSSSSRRSATAARHGIRVAPSQPDIVIERVGAAPDIAILELKASRRGATLGDGLSQLLGYLNERPHLFNRQPSGWLVPLPFDELKALPPDNSEPLWITAADTVAAAVVARFV